MLQDSFRILPDRRFYRQIAGIGERNGDEVKDEYPSSGVAFETPIAEIATKKLIRHIPNRECMLIGW